MLLRGLISVSILSLISTSAFADAVDFNLRDTSAQLQYEATMGGTSLGHSELDMGVIYNQNNNLMGEAGLLVKNDVGGDAPGVSAGIGLKVLAARVATVNANASALAVGGMVRFSPPAQRRLGFVGQLYYAPSIITFGSASRYLETGARIEYDLIPQAVVYLGYRNISFNMNNVGSSTFDSGFDLGVRMSF